MLGKIVTKGPLDQNIIQDPPLDRGIHDQITGEVRYNCDR
jgi:hypothetical protein